MHLGQCSFKTLHEKVSVAAEATACASSLSFMFTMSAASRSFSEVLLLQLLKAWPRHS